MVLSFTLLELLGKLSFCASEESVSNGTTKSRRVALPRLHRTVTKQKKHKRSARGNVI